VLGCASEVFADFEQMKKAFTTKDTKEHEGKAFTAEDAEDRKGSTEYLVPSAGAANG